MLCGCSDNAISDEKFLLCDWGENHLKLPFEGGDIQLSIEGNASWHIIETSVWRSVDKQGGGGEEPILISVASNSPDNIHGLQFFRRNRFALNQKEGVWYALM